MYMEFKYQQDRHEYERNISVYVVFGDGNKIKYQNNKILARTHKPNVTTPLPSIQNDFGAFIYIIRRYNSHCHLKEASKENLKEVFTNISLPI